MDRFTDHSNEARIKRLEEKLVAAGVISPEQEDVSDVLAIAPEPDPERIKQSKQRFKERAALLKRIDEAIDVLLELAKAEKSLRRDIEAAGLTGIDKFTRELIRSDSAVISAILSRLARGGIGKGLLSHDVPPVSDLAKVHSVILQQLGASK